jgi:hypothetical protein
MSSILSSSSKTREGSVSSARDEDGPKAREESGSKTRDESGSKTRDRSEEKESSVEVVKVREVKGTAKGKGIRVVSEEVDVEEDGGGEREV